MEGSQKMNSLEMWPKEELSVRMIQIRDTWYGNENHTVIILTNTDS